MKIKKSKVKLLKRGHVKAPIRPAKLSSVKSKSQKDSIKRLIRKNSPIHKRFLLHPITLFGLLCLGVFIGGWTIRTVADTVISSIVEAPALPVGAYITNPIDGAVYTTASITISGTCPDGAYVKLFINGVYDSVAWCTVDNAFSIDTSLFSGENTLLVSDYNNTNLQGPVTPSIQVIYNAPATVTAPTSSSSTATSSPTSSNSEASTSPTVLPLLIGSDFHFQTFTKGSVFTWQINLDGGSPPYVVYISWGDGSASTLHLATDPIINLTHTYDGAGYYPIVVRATDSKGQQKISQLAALITNSAGVIPGTTTPTTTPTSQSLVTSVGNTINQQKWLLLAWPAYLIVVLMAISFWLGEKRRYTQLKAH